MAESTTVRGKGESIGMELEEIGKSVRSEFQFPSSNSWRSNSMREDRDDEYELQLAAVERMSTSERARLSAVGRVGNGSDGSDGKAVVDDYAKLGALEKRLLMERLIKHIEEDNRRLLQKQRDRMDRVNVKLPSIEVRYRNLNVEAECEVVQGKALPTLWNTVKGIFWDIAKVSGLKGQEAKIRILKDVNGVIKPSRMTLLLGPPGCGKTTLLLSLAGKLGKFLKVTGEVSYNGFRLEEFVPEKTSAYVSQYDLHIPQMTVRETLDFSARFQGVGNRAEIMQEVCRREREAGIIPEPDIDTYMKAISVERVERSLQTDYILKIMGMDICADTMIGDAMRRGISGGQKKRLTTGEMIVGPKKVLFMDEISTGLDSSTTFQVVACLQQLAHITEATIVVSLLQPAPETYDLFDDIILMAEGRIVYHGPRQSILNFFEVCGFKCPERKGAAEFLQEVLSRKDQKQYWSRPYDSHHYISIEKFSEKFKSYHVGQSLEEELSKRSEKSQSEKNALSFKFYSLPKWELFKTCMARELLLMKRNSFTYIFKTIQLVIVAIITMTVFLRTRMKVDVRHANYYLGCLFYTINRILVNGLPEIVMTASRLPVFYKHRDFYLYPAWAYAIPACILKVPISLIESLLWTSMTYYVIGYSPEASRFFRQFLLLSAVHQMSLSLFRLIASYFQSTVVSLMIGNLALLVIMVFGGFILPKPSIPGWLKWGFWISPVSYAEIGLTVNEFLASRWQKISSANKTIEQQVLTSHGLGFPGHFYWISLAALLGYIFLFNLAFTFALTFRKPPGKSRAIISLEKLSQLQGEDLNETKEELMITHEPASPASVARDERTGKMVLPFVPLTITFQNVHYYVDTPQQMSEHGYAEKRLQLLHNITGALRPGILSALMGVSGAGKTTLLDVLSGRKTGGFMEGDIRIGGYPKVQETFARISGYCEQIDIHSPQITVEESVIYSAWLRLPSQTDTNTRSEFINEVLETIELDGIKDCLVGIPGVNGLSTEQRKRLTIAVELVSNPSIIFLDEPTSGLDARAAAIVMRAVKNIVRTRRTVVCTIHQPGIDIFEAFDELILMKRGGELIYSGQLGHHSSKVIKYFEDISGIQRIKDNYNPATWMLEVTTPSVEMHLGIDFAQTYRESSLFRDNIELVKAFSSPPTGSEDLIFPTRFAQNDWVQFKACLWKQHLSYWRSPSYNVSRMVFMLVTAVTFAALFWNHGKRLNNQQDLFNMLGSMFLAVIFLGINSCSSILPFIATERIVLYRETFAGMYSPWAYSFAQMVIEIPYVFIQVLIFVVITYPTIGYYSSFYKFLWFFYTMFCSLLGYTYQGMLIVSLTPNLQVASIVQSPCNSMMNLFSGFILPAPQIPKWWIWFYYINPVSWALNCLLTSQYGDINDDILVFGERKSVASFIEDYFGFRHDRLGFAAVILFVLPLIYGSFFAFCIAKLNFQKR